MESCCNSPPVCALHVSSSRSSPATDSPDTPSPLPNSAFQLAVEAKELVAGVCSPTADDKGTELGLNYHSTLSNSNNTLEQRGIRTVYLVCVYLFK